MSAVDVVFTCCSSCQVNVTVDLATGEVSARRPSNGVRGRGHVAAAVVVSQGVLDAGEGLLLWECPVCEYADSTYVDEEVRLDLAG